jgi:hypothetical protein
VDVSAAPSYSDAHLPFVHNEYCAFLLLVDYAVFDASAADAFKQSDITHFVTRNFNA